MVLMEVLACPLWRFVLGCFLDEIKPSGNHLTGTLELSGVVHDLQLLRYCRFVRFFSSKF